MKQGTRSSYLIATAISVALTAVICFLFSGYDEPQMPNSIWNYSGYAITFFFFIVWTAVYSFLRKSDEENRIRTKKETEDLLKIEEDFVLVLRPFTLDKKLDSYTVSSYDTFVGFGTQFLTLEEQITDAFASYGLKVVGIADNKRKELYIGYERYAADNSDWKEKVRTLIEKSKYICFLGFGEGEFNWEIDEVFDQFCLSKTIIFYPGSRYYANDFKKAYSRFGIELDPKGYNLLNENVFGGVLYYDKNLKKFSQYAFMPINKKREILLNTKNFLFYYVKNLPFPEPKKKSLWDRLLVYGIVLIIILILVGKAFG